MSGMKILLKEAIELYCAFFLWAGPTTLTASGLVFSLTGDRNTELMFSHPFYWIWTNTSIWKNACCDLHKYVLQFEKPLVSSLTGDRSAKPTYNQIFHPISGSLPLNSPVNWTFTKILAHAIVRFCVSNVSMCQICH